MMSNEPDTRTPQEIEQDHAEEDVADELYRERHGDEPREDPDLITAGDVASARHCEIRIDGLPGQLPSGTYAVAFSGMEYPAGAGRPVLRFRYAGELNDDATVKQPAGVQAEREKASRLMEWPQPSDEELAVRAADARKAHPQPAAEQAEAEGWLMPPAELPAVYRTRSGKIITDAMIEGWAAEAEAGYDPSQFAPPQPQRQGLWRDADSPPQPPQQVPDLYQVSTVETINVSKLARVIAELIRKGGLLSPEMIGMKLDPGQGPTREQVERWLRS